MVQFLFIVPRRDQGVSFGKGSKKNCLLSSNPKGGFQRVVVSQLEKKSVRVRDVQSDLENWNQMKSGIFMHVLLASLLHLWCKMDGMILDASCTGTFASATKGSQRDSITVILELLSFLQDELERTFSGAPF